MQRVCQVAGGVKEYLQDPTQLVTAETRRCPFCRDRHRLRWHGGYMRQALVVGQSEVVQVPIFRLLCARQGRTVSLLPDFCLPRRQHGPGMLGQFLEGLAQGKTLLGALRGARPEAPGHSVAQSLLGGFQHQRQRLLAYLATLRHRVVTPSCDVPRSRRLIAQVVAGFIAGFRCVVQAFQYHARRFHERFGVGFA